LLEESRVTVGRFLKTLSNFGDSSLASSDEPSRFVPSISSLPKALQNVKAQVAVMLEQLSQLLAAEESQSGSRPGTRDRTRDSTTFITSLPTPPAQRKMSSPSSLQEKVHKESERQEETPEDQAEGEDGPAAASTEETLNLESILTSASISKVLDNPKADRLIFESLMSATPDLSNQNLRVDRERNKVLVKDSAVAHLLGIELPVLAEDQDQGEHDVSGIPHEEDPGITREPRGWDATLPKHDHTAILQRSKIKNLSNHLVDRRRRREMKETAEIEKKMKEQEAREKRKYEEGKGKANDDWF